MYEYQQIELAATYCLKAAELQDRVTLKLKYIDKLILGEVLFHSREYAKSIFITTKFLFDSTVQNDFYVPSQVLLLRFTCIALLYVLIAIEHCAPFANHLLFQTAFYFSTVTNIGSQQSAFCLHIE